MIRLCLDRDRLCIGTTGITIDPTLWDKDYQKVKGRTTVALQVNKKLEGIRTELQGIADKLELENTGEQRSGLLNRRYSLPKRE